MTTRRLLSELGERVALDGPSAHHQMLLEVANLARLVAPGAAAVLADPAAPPVARARALAVAARALHRDLPARTPAPRAA